MASGVVTFYDEDGTYLEPRFNQPNQSGELFGPVGWVQSGTYELVPNPTANHDSFALALYETQVMEPNQWFSSIEQLKAILFAKGVPVELQAKET